MKFGIREICDVTFKAAANNQKVGARTFKKYQPVFTIDTAQTSNMEQASTTVYAQGGKGYNRLIAWEGEKTLTFTVTDALMSPMGLAVLTSAGLIEAGATKPVHVHCTIDAAVVSGIATISYAELADEIGVRDGSTILVCGDDHTPVYGTLLDGSGYGYNWFDHVAITNPSETTTGDNKDTYAVAKNGSLSLAVQKEVTPATDPATYETDTSVTGTVKFDFYVVMKSGATEITIEPGDFGGYFYVEADTLYRREDTGEDMAATLTFPRVKVQSAFTFTMAASGDPSTFDFTMDAFPGYTQFDATKKVCVTMAIVGADAQGTSENASHSTHQAGN